MLLVRCSFRCTDHPHPKKAEEKVGLPSSVIPVDKQNFQLGTICIRKPKGREKK